METDDAHLLCLDARSGSLLWDVEYADKTKHYGATSAPLVVKDEVIVGTSGGDSACAVSWRLMMRYGELKWRFWTIPARENLALKLARRFVLHGGATTWMPGTYDPELNTLVLDHQQRGARFCGRFPPGDDLYTACVLALNPDTGKLKWHFQFTPHDLYDYDANQTPVLVDVEDGGATRRLLVQANRNGFLYVLDRTQWQVPQSHTICAEAELGHGRGRIRPPHTIGSNSDRERYLHLSRYQRGHQLVFAFLQSRHQDFLCPGARELQPVLHGAETVYPGRDFLWHGHETSA